MNKLKMLLYGTVGFILGFTFMYFFVFNNFLNILITTKNNMIITVIGGIILALVLIIFINLKFKNVIYYKINTDKDHLITLNLFNKINILSLSTTVLGFLLLSLTILLIGKTSFNMISILLLLISIMIIIYSNFQSLKLLTHYFSFSNISFENSQSLKENNLFSNFDEGEQFIMLNSLFKSHQIMTYLLFALMIILSIYQSFTQENQILSIISLFMVIIISNYIYYKKSIEFNKD